MVAKTRDPASLITQSQLAERLHYNPETGSFFWLIPPSKHLIGDLAGRLNTNGYLQVWLLGKRYLLHRLAFLAMTGSHPADEVDHIDGSRINNKWSNLRNVSSAENSKNRKIYSRNRSGASGVHYDRKTGEWIASIRVDGKLKNIGSYPMKFEAKKARRIAEEKYAFHANHAKR